MGSCWLIFGLEEGQCYLIDLDGEGDRWELDLGVDRYTHQEVEDPEGRERHS